MIHVIYLAAGLSSRFGSNKLLEMVDGNYMFRHLLDILIRLKEKEPYRFEIIVVTAYDEIENNIKERGIKVVRNYHQQEGISHSIELGIRTCSEIAESDYVMFCVADQPYMNKEELCSFLDAFFQSQKGIGCLSHNGIMGNPVIFHSDYVPELLALTGDTGGKKVVREHLDDVLKYEVANEKSLQDIDRPECLKGM